MTIPITPASTDASSLKETVKPTKSEHYYDDEGDLEILSSDNVLFKLHAYQFQASSSVFRDMLKVGTACKRDIIEFTDCDLESSDVFTSFLHLMLKDSNILDKQKFNLTKAGLVVRFAQKYDFAHELRTMIYQLQVALSSFDMHKRSPRSIFVIGCLLNETDICVNALRKAGSGWQRNVGDEPGQEKRFGSNLKGGPIFDLTTCELADLKVMPIEIIWALLRASHKPPTLTGPLRQAEHDEMAEKFSKLMQLEGAPKFA